MRNHVEEPLPQQYIPQQQQYIPQQQQYIPQQQQYIPQQQQYIPQQQQYIPEQQYIPQQPVEPAVKHSYIYNKYFKDYNDNFQPEPKVLIPKTIEEYRQMVQEERQKAIEERNRIAQIKSTKLLFTTNQGHNVDNTKPTTIKPSRNSLRSMNFR
jgi:hypothetical protein